MRLLKKTINIITNWLALITAPIWIWVMLIYIFIEEDGTFKDGFINGSDGIAKNWW